MVREKPGTDRRRCIDEPARWRDGAVDLGEDGVHGVKSCQAQRHHGSDASLADRLSSCSQYEELVRGGHVEGPARETWGKRGPG